MSGPLPTPLPTPLRAFEFSAAFGGGHAQASAALVAALRRRVPLELFEGDFVSYLSWFHRLYTADLYTYWLKYHPDGYRRFYEWTDRASEPKAITTTFHYLGLGGLTRDLRVARPELVLSSFPTNVALADTARRRMRLHFLNSILVTDYYSHHHWARPQADLLMVATAQTKREMHGWGLDPARVVVTGIPIRSQFRELIGADPRPIRERYGLDPELPLLLVSGGGRGTYRDLPRLLSVLPNLGRRVQVLLLAGGGEPGVQQLGGATIHRLGYSDALPELMAAADLVVGKAGGLTVAESTALGVPMVVFGPIPGQEEHNARWLTRHAAGRWPQDHSELRRDLLRLLDPEVRAAHSVQARALSVPDAADRAAAALLDAMQNGLARGWREKR